VMWGQWDTMHDSTANGTCSSSGSSRILTSKRRVLCVCQACLMRLLLAR
jgi:hypothetical protein